MSGTNLAINRWTLVHAAIAVVIGYSLVPTRAGGAESLSATPLILPDSGGPIGFDDLQFSPALHRVIIPGGRSGKLYLINSDSTEPKQIEEIGGFSSQDASAGGHGEGITSADVGHGGIFVTDRTTKTLNVVDPGSKKTLAVAQLAAGPDYVRFVAATNEIWVTEPRAAQIEVFSLPEHGFPRPEHAAIIAFPGGPEALQIDPKRGRAYANLWTDTTLAIDLHQRAIVDRWPNGCHGSRGLALDADKGFIFVGCKEGKLEVLNASNGHHLGEASSGSGVDIIAYNPKLHHVYMPAEESGSTAVIAVSSTGSATVVTEVKTAKGGDCVTVDDHDQVYVCDPDNGRYLTFHDSVGDASR